MHASAGAQRGAPLPPEPPPPGAAPAPCSAPQACQAPSARDAGCGDKRCSRPGCRTQWPAAGSVPGRPHLPSLRRAASRGRGRRRPRGPGTWARRRRSARRKSVRPRPRASPRPPFLPHRARPAQATHLTRAGRAGRAGGAASLAWSAPGGPALGATAEQVAVSPRGPRRLCEAGRPRYFTAPEEAGGGGARETTFISVSQQGPLDE